MRTVALKLPRTVWIEDLAVRMARERDILATLQHEHITRFYDAGVDQTGRPYIAMEFVEGLPIDQYCRVHASTVDDILKMILQVCRALAHAHSRLIVHRGLKPSNILMSAEHGVRLLDFGVAALISEDQGTRVTQFAGRMLTPDYSSPEQIRGESIGTPSDVYSLAVVCYELLTGRRPYDVGRGSIAQAARAIVEVEPRLASEVADPSRSRRLRGDLDAVLHKALKKEAAERYASMAEFADDLERHLRQVPVRARPDRFFYRARKFLERYRWQVAAAALVSITVLAGGGAALWEAHAARQEARRAAAIKNFLFDILRTDDIRIASDRPRSERTVKEMLDVAAQRVEGQFAGQPAVQIEVVSLIAVLFHNSGDLDRYQQVEERRAELAKQYFGPGSREVIEGLVVAADAACAAVDFDKAQRLLSQAAAEMKAARREDLDLRADWLRSKARTLTHSGELPEHDRLVEQAVALYRKIGSHSMELSFGLSILSRVRSERGAHAEALALMKESVRVAETADDPDQAALSGEYINLARQFELNDQFDEADATYRRAQDLAARTWGKQSRNYWAAHCVVRP